MSGAVESQPSSQAEIQQRIHDLLVRMRDGDRDAAATFLKEYGPRFLRRVRDKIGRRMRNLYDSADLMSTLGRRFDEFVRLRQISAADPRELWRLLDVMIDHAVIEKARKADSVRRLDESRGTSEYAAASPREAEQMDEQRRQLERVWESLPREVDREIMLLRLHGLTHETIALTVGLEPANVRYRWSAIAERIKSEFHSTE